MKDFTIGADPEFCCIDSNNRRVTAEELYSNGFGADGSTYSFEARPEPSKDPLAVVRSIREILVSHLIANPKFHNYKWIAGSCVPAKDIPIGGHIHFGTFDCNAVYATEYLSEYVGAISLLLENKSEAIKRRQFHGYGAKDDVRNQDYGFEYRTPASWLTSPYIASGILCLAKIVLFQFINKENNTLIPKRFTFDDFYHHKIDNFRKHLPNIFQEIRSMILYPKYAAHIEILLKLVEENKSWYPNMDMKQAWGLVDLGKKNKISLSSIWKDYL